MSLLIKNGHVVDPVNNINEILDILIDGAYIKKISKNIKSNAKEIFDAKNKIVTPGLIDMHTHLREPGQEQKEKILTGTASAALGGFTSIVCMANTSPPIDTPSTVKLINYITEKEGIINVYPVAAITKNLEGKELTEIGDLYDIGIVGLSDDGNPIMNTELMRRAMEYSTMFDLPILDHCEDLSLNVDGQVNEGFYSTIKGLKGIPDISETVMVDRDVLLAKFTGARLHIQHVSTKKSLKMIEYAKAEGTKVTAEVTPHHFTLTEKEIVNYDTNFKVNPPLRTEEDRKALIQGLKKGTLDVIASDHAPHTQFDKEKEFNLAPFGMIGLETLVPLVFMKLIEPKYLSLIDAIRKITLNPAKILKLKYDGIRENSLADITVIDPNLEIIYKQEDILSKGKNSPFINKKLKGLPVLTVVNGKIVMKNRKLEW